MNHFIRATLFLSFLGGCIAPPSVEPPSDAQDSFDGSGPAEPLEDTSPLDGTGTDSTEPDSSTPPEDSVTPDSWIIPDTQEPDGWTPLPSLTRREHSA